MLINKIVLIITTNKTVFLWKIIIKSNGNKWYNNVCCWDLLWHTKWIFNFLRALIARENFVNSKRNMMATTESFIVINIIKSLCTQNFFCIECLKLIDFCTDWIYDFVNFCDFQEMQFTQISLKLSFTKFYPCKKTESIAKNENNQICLQFECGNRENMNFAVLHQPRYRIYHYLHTYTFQSKSRMIS